MNPAALKKLSGELSSFLEAAQAVADEVWKTASTSMGGAYADGPAARRRVEALPAQLRRIGETLVQCTERYDALVREVSRGK